MAFLVFKILYSIQRDITKDSLYWERIKVKNTDTQWDNILKDETKSLEPFGNMLREGLATNKNSSKIQLELDTNYIDLKYYIQSIS